MRLRKVFAVFFTFCLISSVSLRAAFAEAYYPPDDEKVLAACVNYLPDLRVPNGIIDISGGYEAGFTMVWGSPGSINPFGYLDPGAAPTYLSPIVGSKFAYASAYPGTGETVNLYPALSWVPGDAINTPYRWYFGLAMANNSPVGTYGNGLNWGAATWNIVPYYNASSSNGITVEKLSQFQGSVLPVDSGGNSYPHVSVTGEYVVNINPSHESNAIRQVDIWAYDLYYSFATSSDTVLAPYIPWSFCIPVTAYTDVIEDIYLELVKVNTSLSGNFPQIFSSLSSIVSQLEALNTDTDTIIEILNVIKGLDQQQLSVLNYILTTNQSIDTTVKQIHALMLSEVAGTDELSNTAGSAVDSINTVEVQEQHWQTNMNYNFAQLESEGASLTVLGSGLALVGNMFTSIWSAFGEWNIIFTFPLTLGIALLVIGRISKHDRKVRSDERRAQAREGRDKGGGK